ncbi:hypothetical protein PUN28_009797 [Cardiocondyla obscurior]|uniref:Gustatory receptor n=1 Tax=Cardiocondyla obscurior TaxID=286306 RepID=A0AAW2FMU4_9HYME
MFISLTNFQGERKRVKRGKQGNKWQLFYAKDFQSLMYPCFMFCRIMGIFPYKINATTFEVSKSHYILSIIFICIHSIYILVMLLSSSLVARNDINMSILPGVLGYKCIFVFGGFIMVITFILRKPQMRILQIILKISSKLPSESYKKLSRLIHAKDIIGSVSLIGLILFFIFTLQINCYFYINIITVVFQMDMLYINYVFVLKACFKRINDNLMYMQDYMTFDNMRDSRLTYQQKNVFLIIELKALKKEHLTLSDTVKKLNIIFSMQLVATVIMTFCTITINLYYYITYILEVQIVLMSTWVIITHMSFLFSFTYYITKIAIVIWVCETSKNEALQITTSIHDIINSITDKQIKYEVVTKKKTTFLIYIKLFVRDRTKKEFKLWKSLLCFCSNLELTFYVKLFDNSLNQFSNK